MSWFALQLTKRKMKNVESGLMPTFNNFDASGRKTKGER